MVHRIPGLSEPLLRAARSLLQNILSVAVVAGAGAAVTAGATATPAALGVAAGSASLAAVFSYIYNRMRPAGAPGVGEVKLRANLSWWQNVLSGVVVAGGSAVAGLVGADLKTLGLAAGQAAFAWLVSAGYNVVRPLDAGRVASSE